MPLKAQTQPRRVSMQCVAGLFLASTFAQRALYTSLARCMACSARPNTGHSSPPWPRCARMNFVAGLFLWLPLHAIDAATPKAARNLGFIDRYLTSCWSGLRPPNGTPASTMAPLPTLGPFLPSAVTLLPHVTAKPPLPKSLVLSSSVGRARMRRRGFSFPCPLRAEISSQPAPGYPDNVRVRCRGRIAKFSNCPQYFAPIA